MPWRHVNERGGYRSVSLTGSRSGTSCPGAVTMRAGAPPTPSHAPALMPSPGRPVRRPNSGDGSELMLPQWKLSLRRVDRRLMNDDELGFTFGHSLQRTTEINLLISGLWTSVVNAACQRCLSYMCCLRHYMLKAKFHYASWFGASSELAPNMFEASSELASVMEFGF